MAKKPTWGHEKRLNEMILSSKLQICEQVFIKTHSKSANDLCGAA